MLLACLLLAFTAGVASLYRPAPAAALSGSSFSAGNIIDDAVFYSRNALSNTDIQNFLNAKVPVCDTWGTKPYNGSQTRAQYGASRGNPAPFTCLKDYTENTPNVAANSYCGGLGGGPKRASDIIAVVAQACGINPQVLIVLLQKEQALISDEWPWQIQYRSATGYGCPDTAPCDAEFYGFFNQVYQAAKGFKRYAANPANFTYRANRTNNVLFNPQSSCGSSPVYIQNQATTNLYIYTPYQPNQAALNNLYGTGDSCSAYGNRNFWRMFNDWFGSTRTSATVYTTTYSSTIDSAGAEARIGFSLSQRPLYPVVLVMNLSDGGAFAGFSSGSDRITIQPDTWNRPDLNVVTINGRGNAQTRASDVYLGLSQIGSGDTNFSFINPDFVGKPMITWQPATGSVARMFSPSLNKHVYVTRQNEIDAFAANGYQLEGNMFDVCPGGEASIVRMRKGDSTALAPLNSGRQAELQQQGYVGDGPLYAYARQAANVPVYELVNSAGNYIYTTNEDEAAYITAAYGYTNRGPSFNTCRSNQVPIFRSYSAIQQAHFYTISPMERNQAGGGSFVYEGVGFYTQPTGTPVYRLFSPSRKAHFYTPSASERIFAQNNGYVAEGVAFNIPSSPSSPLPIYRLFNGGNGKHFFTPSASERDAAARSGYVAEGVGFNVQQ